ncbi:MAG: hypothetical protein PHZ17_03965 [Sulfurovum sp.]|nr:hypothetical protein [Sulfurovum sp.]
MSTLLKTLTFATAALFFSGCASSVYYKTELDPTASISKNQIFGILYPENATIEDKKFGLSLHRKMVEKGFNLPGHGIADFIVTYEIDTKTYTGTKSYTSYEPTTSYTVGTVSGSSGSSWYGGGSKLTYAGTTTADVPVSKSYEYSDSYKKIYVDILSRKTRGVAWSGFMSIEADQYDTNKDAMIDKLVDLVGKEFKGDKIVESKNE